MANVVAMQNLSSLMDRLERTAVRIERIENAVVSPGPEADRGASPSDLVGRLRDIVNRLQGSTSTLESAVGGPAELNAAGPGYRERA